MSEKADWYKFQEEICNHFNSIGAVAKTNVSVQGVRTTHNIDVLVKTKFLGEDLTWIIDAKKWKKKISKLQVLGLRTIAEDIGADRAFIISEAGFQSGAHSAAKKTNIKLKTFAELKIDTKELIESEIIKSYEKRLELLETRYWSHKKSIRIKYGLRGDVGDCFVKFRGQELLWTANGALIEASKKRYPIDLETYYEEKQGDIVAHNFQQLINWLNLNLNHLDEKIIKAETSMIQNGDFKPDIRILKDGEKYTTKMMAEAMIKAKYSSKE